MKNYVLYVNSTNTGGSGSDSFVLNYSTFLTHVPYSVLNNGSYLNSAGDSFIANYSTFLTHVLIVY